MYFVKKIIYAAVIAGLYFELNDLLKSPDSAIIKMLIYIVAGVLIGFFMCPDISPKAKSKGQNIFSYILLVLLSLAGFILSTGWLTFVPAQAATALAASAVLFQIGLGIWIAFDLNKLFRAKMKSHFE